MYVVKDEEEVVEKEWRGYYAALHDGGERSVSRAAAEVAFLAVRPCPPPATRVLSCHWKGPFFFSAAARRGDVLLCVARAYYIRRGALVYRAIRAFVARRIYYRYYNTAWLANHDLTSSRKNIMHSTKKCTHWFPYLYYVMKP